MFDYDKPITLTWDWVFKERKERIKAGEAKYGPWSATAFKLTRRTGLNEATEELLDAINYLEMSLLVDEISRKEFLHYETILTEIAERLRSKEVVLRSKQK